MESGCARSILEWFGRSIAWLGSRLSPQGSRLATSRPTRQARADVAAISRSLNDATTQAAPDRDHSAYREILSPLFSGTTVDPLKYACALLRVSGIEEEGWDTLAESLQTLGEIHTIAEGKFPERLFSDEESTRLRLHLLSYAHLIEMDAPYEIIANLLQVRMRKEWTVDPFWSDKRYATWKKKVSRDPSKSFDRPMPYPAEKIERIKSMSAEASLPRIGLAFDDFYLRGLRNAIAHSDYILHDREFRVRAGRIATAEADGQGSRHLSFESLASIINKAYAFYEAFFALERAARARFESQQGKAIPYDPKHKGLLEFLVDNDGLLDGWVVHWPNGSESRYRRSTGSEPMNIRAPAGGGIVLLMGEIHSEHHPFSPLVPLGGSPIYSALDGSDDPLQWPEEVQVSEID